MEESGLPASVSPEGFPAKLWRLVNSPRVRSVLWDAGGRGLLVDEQRFVWEVLGAGPGGDGAPGAAGLFKTKSFTSFIRQLNLYGFHKVAKGLVMEPGPGGRDGGGSAWALHHFHSPHFRRGRPDLLVHLKRLTKSNKAKLAAGLELGSPRPGLPRRLPAQPLRGNLLPAKAAGLGLLTLGQFPQPYHRDSLLPCSYLATSSQNHGPSPAGSPEQTPVPPILWQGSLELLPGHGASPAFPGKGVAFSGPQNFTTQVTYTVQPVASVLPLQQESPGVATCLPGYSFAPSVQFSQAFYPAAALQCCSAPAHTDPLPGSARPAAPTYTHCSLLPENTDVECESNMSEMDERQSTSGTESVNTSMEETDSSVEPRSRKRRHSSCKDKSPDLHLLEGRACKQGYFPKEETRE